MPTRFRTIFEQTHPAQSAGQRVLGITLHRYRPGALTLPPHLHDFWQILVYLEGEGTLRVNQRAHRVTPGTMAVLAPGVSHTFARSGHRPPLCLAISAALALEEVPPRMHRLPASFLADVRESLVRLARKPGTPPAVSALAHGAEALRLLARCLEAASGDRALGGTRTYVARVDRALAALPPVDWTPRNIAAALSRAPAHVNRMIKQECGLTLAQYRDRRRLALAQRLLRREGSVGRVAEQCGFVDQNYFARWFRQQTGVAPTRWREARR